MFLLNVRNYERKENEQKESEKSNFVYCLDGKKIVLSACLVELKSRTKET
jgi:hypothetical protein